VNWCLKCDLPQQANLGKSPTGKYLPLIGIISLICAEGLHIESKWPIANEGNFERTLATYL
jgi:hypothetical protein